MRILDPAKNLIEISVLSSFDTSTTSFVISTSDQNKLADPSISGSYNGVLYNFTDYSSPLGDSSSAEIIRIIALSSTNNINVSRAQENTIAISSLSGKQYKIQWAFTAKELDDIDHALTSLSSQTNSLQSSTGNLQIQIGNLWNSNVPYTGATANVNLSSYSLSASNLTANTLSSNINYFGSTTAQSIYSPTSISSQTLSVCGAIVSSLSALDKTTTLNNLSPLSNTGDLIYFDGTNNSRLGGNINNAIRFLASSGDGTYVSNLFWTNIEIAGTQSYFLDNSTSSTLTGSASSYLIMSSTSITGTTTVKSFSISGNSASYPLCSYITPSGYPNTVFIPDGVWHFHIHASVNNTSHPSQVYAKVYKKDTNGIETLLLNIPNSPNLTTSEVGYDLDYSTDAITLTASDRIVLKVLANITGFGPLPTISLSAGGEADSRLDLPANSIDVNSFVPYNGATNNVNLSSYSLSAANLTANTLSSNINYLGTVTASTITANGITAGTMSSNYNYSGPSTAFSCFALQSLSSPSISAGTATFSTLSAYNTISGAGFYTAGSISAGSITALGSVSTGINYQGPTTAVSLYISGSASISGSISAGAYKFSDGTTQTSAAVSLTRNTFTSANLSSSILAVTHSKGLSAPYSLILRIFDSTNAEIIPDGITGATNSFSADLTSYNNTVSISGTWGYIYTA